jgi:hypothetical protein
MAEDIFARVGYVSGGRWAGAHASGLDGFPGSILAVHVRGHLVAGTLGARRELKKVFGVCSVIYVFSFLTLLAKSARWMSLN